jgi:hypothetical protein
VKFVNLTPHPVVLSNGALRVTFEKDYSTPVARVEQVIEQATIECEIVPGMKIDMPVNAVTRSEVYNLPDPEPGVMLIVSSMVATQVKRADVIAPITDSTCERDVNGRVLSVKGFQTFNEKYTTPAMAEVASAVEEAEEAQEAVSEDKKVAYRNGRLVVSK